MQPEFPDLPLSEYREDFIAALGKGPLLLEAEPGAGKSTLAPLWALEEAPQGEVVWLIQPRVLPTRALARRLAELLGEAPGRTVGYQVPYERRAGDSTRLLVMTPGILLQQLLHNPTLDGVSTVILDEVHERSVNQDTAWAWLQEVYSVREDLRLVLMSATPDPALRQQVSQRLLAPGRCFPVSVEYWAPKVVQGRTPPLEQQVLEAVRTVPDWQARTVLVFLPGWRAIEDSARALRHANPEHPLYRLHSRVDDREQALALDPESGARVILATNIAETSLTIADVTLVVDSGLARRPDYEQRTGISRLSDRRISRASADQRAGRAGRVQPGQCLRLWSQDLPLAAADLPEIRATDFLPLALRLAHWGTPAGQLSWLEAPNPIALAGAQEQLAYWKLLDQEGRVTKAGRQVAALGTHPRLAALLQSQGSRLATPLLNLALALHFEWLPDDVDNWLLSSAAEAQRNPQWRQQRRRWLQVLAAEEVEAGALDPQALAWAFRDRIGRRVESGRYRLNTGISVSPAGPLDEDWAVFPHIAAQGRHHRGAGFPLSLDQAAQRRLSQPTQELVHTRGQWCRQTQWWMGGVRIAEQSDVLPPAEVPEALCAHIASRDLLSWPWQPEARQLLLRARLAAQYQLAEFPDVSEEQLRASLSQWLEPFLDAATRLEALPWRAGLEYYLGHERVQRLEDWLPTHLSLPSGRRAPIDYPDEGLPEISAKLQEFFGCESLALAQGRVPLRIHLASPNGSPLAITADLASFWKQAYPEVRKQMRGRYPKHPWPEDPLTHTATHLTKKRLQEGGV
ncbi:ATP-dependent helicase HrpB [Marinimicrobium sp. ABcell2]|uniref:ATP-dependent helicase HrpB n=1 Tax=Marinimicrobium sp. ABcell2 TaxID=3069751 RepID=UPI0027B55FB9|nr:ATP-dependent helicase HrpB [Marinimicrobium sp. ABcell2]MDQ2078284.1 ATP-dependent helicase HrpB [Marinimicrobium sp. ABcell2]